jgi:hypothetical protein
LRSNPPIALREAYLPNIADSEVLNEVSQIFGFKTRGRDLALRSTSPIALRAAAR